jgi:hypothetical protein
VVKGASLGRRVAPSSCPSSLAQRARRRHPPALAAADIDSFATHLLQADGANDNDDHLARPWARESDLRYTVSAPCSRVTPSSTARAISAS